jgi:hypothetical protein
VVKRIFKERGFLYILEMESAITSRNNWIGKEFKRIKELTKEKNVLITDHAWDVMDKRGISPK